jgi:hypothetical protein
MSKKNASVLYKRSKGGALETTSQRLPTWAWFAIGGVVAVALIAGLFYLGSRSIGDGGANAARDIQGAVILPDPGAGHVDGDISYTSEIPAGGQHNPVWQNCGIYEEPIRTENAIHSMEHGAVWIAYNADLPADQVEQLRELIRDERSRLRNFYILSPKEGLSSPIIVTAWRAQLKVDNASDDNILKFMQRFHIGPYTPERGATCSGGAGEPS